MTIRRTVLAGGTLPLALLSGCGGGGGGGAVASTPAPAPLPVPAPIPAPMPTPTPTPSSFDTAEYRRSNTAAQAQALTAYNAGATGLGVIAGVIDSGIDLSTGEFPRIDPNSAPIWPAVAAIFGAEGEHGVVVSQVLLGAKNDLRTQGHRARCDAVGAADGHAGQLCGSHRRRQIARTMTTPLPPASMWRAARARRSSTFRWAASPANSRLRSAIDRRDRRGRDHRHLGGQ